MGEEYEIRDPVYGFITFNNWEKEIIGHPVLQRLRRIRQLALTEMVYPGATHTRFEHSIGVMHLATKMYDAIMRDDKNINLLKEELNYQDSGLQRNRQLVRLSALLHDVGHPPFSHAPSDIFDINPHTKKQYKHEDYTIKLIKGPLKNVIENHDINKTNFNISCDEIAALVEGNPKILGKRVFWKVIISSQLDADKGDYLVRDSLHTGVKYGLYDLDRLLVTLALGKDPETDDVILGIKEGGWHVAESLIIARYQIFSQVYFHKTRRAYDFMLKQFLINNIGKLPPPEKIEEFIDLDDYKIWHMVQEKNDDYWSSSIIKRNHIKKVYETKDIPKPEDLQIIKKIEKHLKSKKIWYYKDLAGNLWYKLNENETNKEIMIIPKNEVAVPLSKYSNIVKNLGESRQIRIYVKSEDREKAERVISQTGE